MVTTIYNTILLWVEPCIGFGVAWCLLFLHLLPLVLHMEFCYLLALFACKCLSLVDKWDIWMFWIGFFLYSLFFVVTLLANTSDCWNSTVFVLTWQLNSLWFLCHSVYIFQYKIFKKINKMIKKMIKPKIELISKWSCYSMN